MCVLNKSNLRRPENLITVDWHDCACSVPVMVQRPPALIATTFHRGPGAGAWSIRPLSLQSLRYQPMSCPSMKNHSRFARRSLSGFTIVELLTVIAIIAILAAMLLPAISAAKVHAQKVKALTEETALAGAIEAYDSTYGRFPVSAAVQSAAAQQASGVNVGDFTYGTYVQAPTSSGGPYAPVQIGTTQLNGNVVSNGEVIAILMDITNHPDSPSQFTVNTNHVKNPQQIKFLNATMAPDTNSSGVGPDLVYRDPWGTPYFITMDLNYDEQCDDAFYGQENVSQMGNSQNGYNGLFDNDSAGHSNHYQFHGKVMVWSAGPDKKVDPYHSAVTKPNKDNVISW